MAEIQNESSQIKDTDIIFDCPYCGKSLAIDYRGAGLYIPCTDCGKSVAVPIPEGMELEDIDSTDSEKEIKILHLRKSLAAAEYRIRQLETEIDRIDSDEAEGAGFPSDLKALRETVAKQAQSIGKAVKEISDSLEELIKAAG